MSTVSKMPTFKVASRKGESSTVGKKPDMWIIKDGSQLRWSRCEEPDAHEFKERSDADKVAGILEGFVRYVF
jgi:hypothetical protein